MRFVFLHDDSLIHKQHPAAYFAGKAHLVGHHHHGHAVLRQFLHNIQHFAHHFGVQRAGRLIKEHHFRIHAQRPHNGNPLLLPAGKLAGIGVRFILQPYTAQQRQRLCFGVLLTLFQQSHGGQRHIAQDGHIVKQIKVLEHHAHLLPVQVNIALGVGNFYPIHKDGTIGGGFQQVQAPQKGGFAAAGGADDHHHFAFFHFGINALEHLQAAKRFFQIFYLNNRFSGHCCAASFPVCLPAS